MRRLLLPLFAAALLSGCWFISKPQAVVIVTDKSRAASLITALQAQFPGLKASDVAVKVVARNAPDEVLKWLDWAVGSDVKTVGIDGDSYPPGDPKVAPKLKMMNASGFYVAGVEFAG